MDSLEARRLESQLSKANRSLAAILAVLTAALTKPEAEPDPVHGQTRRRASQATPHEGAGL